MFNENLVIIGIAVNLIGTVSYLIDTLKGKVKPNRVSFLLWSLAPMVAFFAQIKEGVGMQALLTFSIGFSPMLVFISSFISKKAEWKLTRFDLTCGMLSVIGFILWLITKQGIIAIFFSLLADGLASLPTIVKSYKYPETEAAWPWLGASFSGLCTLLTIKSWNFATSAFPIYVLIVNFVIYFFVQSRIGKK